LDILASDGNSYVFGKTRKCPLGRPLAHRRRFDAVVVWKFDRCGRSVSHLLRAPRDVPRLGRIEFVSLSEQVDTSTPTGKMVFTVLGAVAELECGLIVELTEGLGGLTAVLQRLGKVGNPLRCTFLAGRKPALRGRLPKSRNVRVA
jgi:hypothetical protein